MQRNIDSFFKKVAPAASASKSKTVQEAPTSKKRKARIISDDEEEEQHKEAKLSDTKKTRTKSPATNNNNVQLKQRTPKKNVDPQTLFAVEPKRIKSKQTKSSPMKLEMADEHIDQLLEKNLENSFKYATVKAETSNGKVKIATPARESNKSSSERQKQNKEKQETAKTEATKAVKQNLESSLLSDEERHDRKRMVAMLYQKRQNRPACLNAGCKDIPKGAPNCLAGLSFLVTGVLESLLREEVESIIKEYGGKVSKSVAKRLNYMIVGEEAGPKKLAQAEEYGISIISEDGFLDLIRAKSGLNQTNSDAVKVKQEQVNEVSKTSESTKVKQREASKTPPEKKRKLEPETSAAVEMKHSKLSSIKREDKQTVVAAVISSSNDTAAEPPLLSWVDKYKPTSIKEIVGQQGAAGNVPKLMNWLSKWYINHDGKKKLKAPNPWAKNDDGSYFKAALLSGPPGIGKTTTATLVCKELGFDAVEFNASDTRSKRLLKEQVSELLSNKSLHGYFNGQAQAVTKKHVLIMDEVDGMAGNEDRGGIQELIGLIKDSAVPIICMCNDRNHQKMRSLVNYCYDLRFNRPRLEQIKGRVLSICARERFKIDSPKVEEIITATNNDLRQTINHLYLLSAGKDLQQQPTATAAAATEVKTAQKDLKMGPWEVIRKVFSADEHKHMSFNDKSDLFFHDYSLGPLFVQQNYLQVSPAGPKNEVLRKVALTADALSLGDLIDKRIRSNSAWSLLPTMAVFSSVMPGEYMSGYFTGQPNFPGWLGKNSRANKRSRLAQEINDHTRLLTSGSRLSVRLDYAPFLLSAICRPLLKLGLEGVPNALAVIKEYHLLREDIDALIELSSWPGKKSPMDGVDGRVKAALTRAYNKEIMPYSYSAVTQLKKKKLEAANDAADMLDMQGENEDIVLLDSDEEKQNDDDDLQHDALIKKKAKTAASSKAKASTAEKKCAVKPKAGTSKSKK